MRNQLGGGAEKRDNDLQCEFIIHALSLRKSPIATGETFRGKRGEIEVVAPMVPYRRLFGARCPVNVIQLPVGRISGAR